MRHVAERESIHPMPRRDGANFRPKMWKRNEREWRWTDRQRERERERGAFHFSGDTFSRGIIARFWCSSFSSLNATGPPFTALEIHHANHYDYTVKKAAFQYCHDILNVGFHLDTKTAWNLSRIRERNLGPTMNSEAYSIEIQLLKTTCGLPATR